MSANIPFFRGQNAVLKLYQENKPIYIACKTWDVDENATDIADGVNGENRDRLDKVTNYFTVTVHIFQTDQSVVEKYMEAQEEDDNANLPKVQTGAIQIHHRDGTRACYLLSEMKVGPMKITMSSRQEAVMLQLKLRFRYFKSIPSI